MGVGEEIGAKSGEISGKREMLSVLRAVVACVLGAITVI